MKEKFTPLKLLLFLCSFHFFSAGIYAQLPQFINTNNTGNCNYYPFNNAAPNNRIQWLIRAGEFTGAQSGKAISVLWIRPCGTTSNLNYNLTIKLGSSTITSLSTGSFYTTNMQTVFSGSIQISTTANTWLPIPLQTPFKYDPTQSLIIDIENAIPTFGFTANMISLTGTRRLYNGGSGGDAEALVCGITLKSLGPNNAGLTALTNPVNFCPGTYDVKVNVENAGTNALDSVRINWSIDGVLQSTIYHRTKIDTIGSVSGNQQNITLGTVNFPSGITKAIKVWTSYPNGVTDTVPFNDTISIPLKPSISGVFTIGGTNPDYPTFSAAAADLNAYGICGPVTFNVRAGTYNERIELKKIAGVSSTNTITFIGAGKNSTTITNAGTGTTTWATVLLNGTDYVTFRDMTVGATGNDYAVGFLLADEANYNDFSNININLSTTTTNGNTCGVLVTNSPASNGYGKTGNYNTFDSLIVSGGYYGLRINGQGTGSNQYCLGNKITNCEFINQDYYGIFTYYTGRTVITNNIVRNMRNVNSIGMYIYYTNADIIAYNTSLAQYQSLYLYYLNYYNYESVRSKVHNNIFRSPANTSAATFYYNYYMNLYHNTVVGNAQNQGATYFYYGSGINARNNIFVNEQATATSYSVYINSTGFDKLDYNIYYTNGGNLTYHGSAVANLQTWKNNYPNFNQNSVVSLPNFIGSNDLHLKANIPPATGEDVGITDDIDGDRRCPFGPTIGADESSFPYPNPTISLSLLDTAFENSLSRIINTYSTSFGEKVMINWYVNGVYTDKTKDLDYTFPAAGNYDISVKVENCASSDSVGKTIQVITPTSTPVSDFVASTTNPNLFDLVYFRDISMHGPTSWLWTVTPSDGVSITGETTANPDMMFYEAGFYDVCLTTANALGQGTTMCKKTYISVRDEREMCDDINVSTSATGRLTDDGGLVKSYSSNRNCGFLINTCGQINLIFKNYNLADVQDEIRIYDGANNKAKLLGKFPGGPTAGLPGGVTGLTAASGKMYIEWVTGPSNESTGFEAYWTTIPDTSVKTPVADFTFPSSIYTNNSALFQSTSQGKNLAFEWDFAPPAKKAGSEGGKKDFDRYAWNTADTFEVKLKASNCVGTSEIIKQVTVIDPTSAPTVNFYADKVRVAVLSKLQLFDSSSQGPTSWRWQISGGKVKFETPATSQNPIVYFTAPGFYDVKLIATNSFGADSIVKSGYIEVFSYCLPSVGVVNSDIGISRVQFGNIDNYTSTGTSAYSSYFDAFDPFEVIKRSSFTIKIERSTVIDPMSRKIWVDWNGDADFNDAGEEVAYEAPALTKSYTVTIQVPNLTYSGATVLRVGTSYSNGNNSPCGTNQSGEFEDYPLMIKNDYTIPVITLKGSDTVYVEQWHSYTEAGATASDDIDGNLSSGISISSNVDSTQTGTYYVRYNVSDIEGNKAEEKVRVVIYTSDLTKPVITLLGNTPDVVTVNTSYNDPGATATDYFNRDISGSLLITNNINFSALGSYFMYYTVNDGAGNKDSVVRVVNVVDDIKPRITLVDKDTLYVEVGNGYNEPGYTLGDNFWPSASINGIVDSSAFNSNKTGIYQIIYTAKDNSNNMQTATRWVVVRDLSIPVLDLIGNDTVLVDVYTNYTEPGVMVWDNYCTNGLWQVNSYPDVNTLGDYILTYSAKDCEGNSASAIKRLVRVVDRDEPVLKLKGYANVNIQRWQTYTDEGIDTIIDNYYSEATLLPLVKVVSNVDMLFPGIYSVCYEVTDPSMNVSAQVCRTVNVIESTSGMDVQSLQEEINVYPNPNEGKFSINLRSGFTAQTQVLITDMLGRTVRNVNAADQQQITEVDVTDMPAGVYFVMIKQGDRSASVKISIIH